MVPSTLGAFSFCLIAITSISTSQPSLTVLEISTNVLTGFAVSKYLFRTAEISLNLLKLIDAICEVTNANDLFPIRANLAVMLVRDPFINNEYFAYRAATLATSNAQEIEGLVGSRDKKSPLNYVSHLAEALTNALSQGDQLAKRAAYGYYREFVEEYSRKAAFSTLVELEKAFYNALIKAFFKQKERTTKWF